MINKLISDKFILPIYNGKYFNTFLYLCFFVLPILFWLPTILSGKLFISGDGFSSFLTWKYLVKEALSYGELPTWVKYIAGGMPNAELSTSLFYLPSLIATFLPVEFGLLLYYSFHLSLGAFFTYLYLRQIGVNRLTAITFALIYEFSIHLGGYRKNHMLLISATVWLPVILYFIERYFSEKSIRYLLLAGFALAMQFGVLFQYAFYTGIIVVFYTLALQFKHKIQAKKFIKDALIASIIFSGLVVIFVLPTVYILNIFESYGAVEPGINYFRAHSIVASKLLFLFSPTSLLSGNVYQPGGWYSSSELDIEIFIGVIIFFTIYSAFRYFKNFRVRLFTIIVILTFAFAAHTHIYNLSEVLYNIPILNGFRVSSRILFIFTFFNLTLAAIAVSKIYNDIEIKKVTHDIIILFKLILIAVVLSVVGFLIFNIDLNLTLRNLNEVVLKKILLRDITVVILIPSVAILLYYQISKRYNNLKNVAYFLFIVIIFSTVGFQTLKYNLQYKGSSLADIKDNYYEAEFHDGGGGKVWVASPETEYFATGISFNRGIIGKVLSINSYTAFNNPLLYRIFNRNSYPQYNASELLIGFLDAQGILMKQKGLLSMLGIKYIVDPKNYIDNRTEIFFLGKDGLYKDYPNPKFIDYGNNVFVFAEKIDIKSNEFIKVDFNMFNVDNISFMYLDLNGGIHYDFEETNYTVNVNKKLSEYSLVLYSGIIPDNVTDIYLRFISNVALDIKDVKVYKSSTISYPSPYKFYKEINGFATYINQNAKPILYKPEYISSINNFDSIYTNLYNYDLLNTSYIKSDIDENIDLTKVKTEIEDIKFTTNRIKATVSTDAPTFINFSQVYFPDWHVYIDGKKSEVYMVNGLIMGAKVPAGKHLVEFRFEYRVFYLSAVIFFISLIAMIVIIINSYKRSRYK